MVEFPCTKYHYNVGGASIEIPSQILSTSQDSKIQE